MNFHYVTCLLVGCFCDLATMGSDACSQLSCPAKCPPGKYTDTNWYDKTWKWKTDPVPSKLLQCTPVLKGERVLIYF